MSTTRTQFLRLTCTSEMSRGILEYGSDFVRAAIVGGLSSDPEGFLHELVQSLHRMVELRGSFSEVFHVQIA